MRYDASSFSPSDWPTRPISRIACALSLFVALTAACGAPEPRPRNILLITLDTLRRDHLGGYGYSLDTSPELDAFASHATRFDRAYSTAPWTLPTHASLFTGRHPFEHGARTTSRGAIPPTEKTLNAAPLDLEIVTLAEVLAGEGYRTAAFVSNPLFLGTRFQLDQGFESYTVERLPAVDVVDRATRWLERHTREQPEIPFFVFVNFMDTHRPYQSEPASKRLPPPSADLPGELLKELMAAVMESDGSPPTDLTQRVIEHYDAAIANVDAGVGELLRWLEDRGLYDDTSIAITSDHGEYFGEHDIVEHSKDIYEEAIRIPLIIKAPGQRSGATDTRIVTSVDLARLLLDFDPALRGSHRDAFPYEPGNHPAIVENYYSRAKDLAKSYGARFDRVRTAVLFDDWKFIRSSDGLHEMYDLAKDPAEAHNLIDSAPDAVKRAERILSEFMEGKEVEANAPGIDVGSDEVEMLEELGYL